MVLIVFENKMRFLGIDPGIATVGFGVIEKVGNTYKMVDVGTITTSKDLDTAARLNIIRTDLLDLIDTFKPIAVSVEKLYFSTNVKTAMVVAEARGVILETIFSKGIQIVELNPLEIKQGITGDGKADKKQIQDMLKLILKLEKAPKQDDAADALASALCLAQSWNAINLIH